MTRIIFAGTPAFARASLSALVDAGKSPVAVLTQPDRPAGRGKRLTAGPVKEYALEAGIPVMQPASLEEYSTVETLRSLEAELIVVAAYGLLLPQSVLDLPRCGCVNVHASLLPRWRGAAPVQSAILAGDRKTGISLMRMEAGLDTGPVFCSAEIEIGAAETAGELQERLAVLGGELLVSAIDDICAGRLRATEQDAGQASYAPKFASADARIDWDRPAEEVARHVRAFNPVPGAWTMLDGERLKCWRARADAKLEGSPGQFLYAGSDGLAVACSAGGVWLQEVQRPGRGRISAAEYARQVALEGLVME